MKRSLFIILLPIFFILSACHHLDTISLNNKGDTNNTRASSYTRSGQALLDYKRRCDVEKKGDNCIMAGTILELGWDDTQGKNYTQAMEFYKKGVALNYFRSYQAIGHLYEKGLGVTKDYNQAKSWYERGVNAGDENAMMNLASMYYGGHGVEKDLNKSLEYATAGCAKQNTVCCSYKKSIEQRLSAGSQ